MSIVEVPMSDLARRAVACSRWRWMRGSTALILYREHPCADVEPERTPHVVTHDGVLDLSAHKWMGIANHDPLPDISDPATIGCLLALVREAWCDPSLCVVFDHDDGRWNVGRWEDGLVLRGRGGASEAEALVNALEGAP